MESLNLNESQSENSQTSKPRQKQKPIDRVTLGTEESVLVQAWIAQLKGSTSGFLDITKSDVVNFLIRQHAPELSSKEMKGIRTAHYDPIRHLNWITPRLKDALEKNDSAQVAALQSEIRGIELSIVASAEAPSGPPVTSPKPKRRHQKQVPDSSPEDGKPA